MLGSKLRNIIWLLCLNLGLKKFDLSNTFKNRKILYIHFTFSSSPYMLCWLDSMEVCDIGRYEVHPSIISFSIWAVVTVLELIRYLVYLIFSISLHYYKFFGNHFFVNILFLLLQLSRMAYYFFLSLIVAHCDISIHWSISIFNFYLWVLHLH